ncbi:type I polyketide synthase [Apodospora peruviana]|uniref:Type I polyketide synthase n=1 Tax=Apodospora peruviana TaxID=516989 RepID=A0AAE0I3T9_9PEZI|nr:type I polyketide synthase [Apodospora peruviana]
MHPTSNKPLPLAEVLIFGDQCFPFAPPLQKLLLKKDSPHLVSFFEQINITLRREISSLSTAEKQLFPSFSNVQELVAGFQKLPNCPALESALACCYHLAAFIHHYDSPSQTYPRGQDTYITGLCVGSLAAAAISCSGSLRDLVTAGLDAVRVALRLGLQVHHTASLFESKTLLGTWSILVSESVLPRASAHEVLTAFAQDEGLGWTSAPYISSVSHRTLTISGPPSSLNKFVRSKLSSSRDAITFPLHGPYHAAHLFTEDDIGFILSCAGPISRRKALLPVISSSSGEIFAADNSFEELLHLCLKDILLLPLDATRITQAVSQILDGGSIAQCTLKPIGTTIGNSIQSMLQPHSPKTIAVDQSLLNEMQQGNHAVRADDDANIKTTHSGRPSDSKIAIVGMSGRFPDAADLGSFWDLLYQGRDVHRQIPEDRFDAEKHHDATGRQKNTSKVLNGCFIEEPGLFDAKFFNISPKEAEQSDPGQRLALETAYEALEMAGIVPDRTPSTRRDRVAVFYGMTSDDWREVNSGQNVDTYFIPGGNRAFTPGRLNYFFKFSGPSASIDTACSSSLTAVHTACNSLWRNDCDMAIAGGTNVMTNPDNFAGLDRGHFLSRTGNCNTFDDGADGYCRADGVGTVILKRLEDAQADNDPILGVILGAYTNHSAEAVSITRPHAGAQQYIFSKLLRESGVHPYDISYVEMHGTGTQAGDATEMTSVLQAFAPTSGPGGRRDNQSLHLGSVKANVGHGESASGVVALIKTLLMMQTNTIPPHCGIKTKINHSFPLDFAQRNVHIARKPTTWIRPDGSGGVRRAFVNNFSAAGGNSALLLEDGPRAVSAEPAADPRSVHIVTVSAKSVKSLRKNIENLQSFVKDSTDSPTSSSLLSKLSYTTTARRMHHYFRVAIPAQDTDQLLKGLDAAKKQENMQRIPAVKPPVGFIFTGQGAQYTGMGKECFDNFSTFRQQVLIYDKIARSYGFPSILPLITGQAEVEHLGPVEVQLSQACLQMALAKLWQSLGVEPSFVLGHSLGHYAALNVAGVLSASETIYLTGTRAQLLLQRCEKGSHSMLAVRASLPQVTSFLNTEQPGVLEVACINGPRDIVVSGTVASIDRLADTLANDNIKATRVKVPFAFHSAQVEPILEELEAAASRITFRPPLIPVLCALEATIYRPGDQQQQQHSIGPKHISRHCREAVNFEGVLKAAQQDTPSAVWIEIGPHAVCSSFVKACLGPNVLTAPSLRRNEDYWKVMTASLGALYSAGLDIDWNEYHREFESCHQVLRLPSYSWDHKNYWIQYKNDWCLTKGDDVVAVDTPKAKASTSFQPTPSVQRVLQETVQADGVLSMIVESDLAHPLLDTVINGHIVNNTKVCTSSVYADIGLTLGQHVIKTYRPDLNGYAVDVCGMAIHNPLILKDNNNNPDGIPATALFSVELSYPLDGTVASMSIFSVDAEKGGRKIQHANCELHLCDPKVWKSEWQRHTHMVKRSIEYLEGRATKGLDSILSTGMAYKIFTSLVDYQDEFKGLGDVILHSDELEATARVRLNRSPKGGFLFNPMWIDSCGQTTGFLMNCHQTTTKDKVYVNHGWGSIKIAEPFRADGVYRTYVRMRSVDGNKYAGDLYILDEETGEIIGFYGDHTFQELPRRILDTVLPGAGARHAAASDHHPRGGHGSPPSRGGVPMSSRLPLDHDVEDPTGDVVRPPLEADSPFDSQLRPLLRILSEEIGLSLEVVTDDKLSFIDYGVDSLLSLTITGRMRELLNIDISSAAFLTCSTLGELKTLLGFDSSTTSSSANTTDVSDDNDDSSGEETSATSSAASEPDIDSPAEDKLHQFRATSTLLQGTPSKAQFTLFLIPDGSGSATSYASLPPILPDSNVAVYGLNCPWLKDAKHLDEFGLPGLVQLYVEEIQRRSPNGPYNLGGWSAGGICAYEAALLLTKAGHNVERLFFLDSPCPIGLGKLPERLYDFLDAQNVFGSDNPHSTGTGTTNKAPAWLLAHFLAFVNALDRNDSVPWDVADWNGRVPQPPRSYFLWAEDGVCKNVDDVRPEYRDDDPAEMKWLLENRTNFGSNGWDAMLGPSGRFETHRISGVNHFTMLKPGRAASAVSAFLAGGLLDE